MHYSENCPSLERVRRCQLSYPVARCNFSDTDGLST